MRQRWLGYVRHTILHELITNDQWRRGGEGGREIAPSGNF